jgi:hypothetical protein
MKKLLKMIHKFCVTLFSLFMFSRKSKAFSLSLNYLNCLSMVLGFEGKTIWHSDGIPKVNHFCWLLAHWKFLTTNNLKKWGICGPSLCVLCRNAKESLQHLFIECLFVKETWNHAMGVLNKWIRVFLCKRNLELCVGVFKSADQMVIV